MTIADVRSVFGLLRCYSIEPVVADHAYSTQERIQAEYKSMFAEKWRADHPVKHFLGAKAYALTTVMLLAMVIYGYTHAVEIQTRARAADVMVFAVVIFLLLTYLLLSYKSVDDPDNKWRVFEFAPYFNAQYRGKIPKQFFKDCEMKGFLVNVERHSLSKINYLTVIDPNDVYSSKYFIDSWGDL